MSEIEQQQKKPFYKRFNRFEWLIYIVGAGILIYAQLQPYIEQVLKK